MTALQAITPVPVAPRPQVPGGIGGAPLPAAPAEAGATDLNPAGVSVLVASAATAFAEDLASAGGPTTLPIGDSRAFAPASALLALATPSGTAHGLSFATADPLAEYTQALPGADALTGLLAGLWDRPPQPVPAAPTDKGPTPYYFLDPYAAPATERSDRRLGARSIGAVLGDAHPGFDVEAVRRDFPILAERVNGRPLIWFDNAATTQKPNAVIERLAHFYRHENSNIHRAAHELAARATEAYEGARRTVARFLGASSPDEIVFLRGTTEAINLVAKSWGPRHVGPGDEIIVSLLEHHANIVPWQQLAAATGARIRVIPVDSDGQILLGEYQKLLNDRTRIVAISQVSNALGTITPVPEVIDLAHRAGARVLVDGAQSVAHLRVDVRALDADFFVFSGHKIFGPTGIGALYGKGEVLEAMDPWQGGGNMITDVTFERTL
ncbi:MAG TPA: cysteine desulfurase, partial [Lamprocystis sp. (in: g-proteobacteria)]|nr:cysteine desulfurase [Lamprocystis sp. (in: g-proteobacteria)]